MSHVRLPLVCRDFLMSCVESETLIRDDSECKELLLEAMKYHLLPEQRSLMSTKRTSERRPDGLKPYVFAVGKKRFFVNFWCLTQIEKLFVLLTLRWREFVCHSQRMWMLQSTYEFLGKFKGKDKMIIAPILCCVMPRFISLKNVFWSFKLLLNFVSSQSLHILQANSLTRPTGLWVHVGFCWVVPAVVRFCV